VKLLRLLVCFLFNHRWRFSIVKLPCGHCEDLHLVCKRCGDADVRPWVYRWSCPEHPYCTRALKIACPRDNVRIDNVIAPKELL
jgi:hypothetical protein